MNLLYLAASEPRGEEDDIFIFVDFDYAGDKVPQRPIHDFLMYVNTTLVLWFSKKQSLVETHIFGIDYVAMKKGMSSHSQIYEYYVSCA